MMKKITVDAVQEQLEAVTAFVDESLEELGGSIRAQMQIDVAVDEIFSNIARYAYGESAGRAEIQLESLEGSKRVRLTFKDEGIPFDPRKSADPDVTAGLDEREPGGLGIFLVKKTMENLQYRYENGKNVFSFEKTIQEGNRK